MVIRYLTDRTTGHRQIQAGKVIEVSSRLGNAEIAAGYAETYSQQIYERANELELIKAMPTADIGEKDTQEELTLAEIYEQVTGKKPHPRWLEETIERKLQEWEERKFEEKVIKIINEKGG